MSGDPTMEMLQESGWEELRKEARKIEGDLDVKLSSYAKLGARFTQGGGAGFLKINHFPTYFCNWVTLEFQSSIVIMPFVEI